MRNRTFYFKCLVMICGMAYAQNTIKPDMAIMRYLQKMPQKTKTNILPDNLIAVLYYDVQPKDFPKIGYFTKKGEIMIEPIYNMGMDYRDGYANIIKDSVYGYIDKQGRETLFPQYQSVYFYYGNTGIAKKDNKYGLITRNGDSLTPFYYKSIKNFDYDHFNCKKENGTHVILNAKGELVFENPMNHTIISSHFASDSLMVYQEIVEGKKYNGIIDLTGEIIVQPIYQNISFVNENKLHLVKKNKKYGLIDDLGKEIIPPIYERLGISINGNQKMIPAQKDGKWGYINRKNEILIPFMYEAAYPFSNEIAFVKKGRSFGCIDITNTIKIPFDLEETGYPFFSDELALIKQGDKYGYINKNGKIEISPIYDHAMPFIEGMAYVELRGKAGYINKKGKEIIPIKYNQLWFMSEGVIRFSD